MRQSRLKSLEDRMAYRVERKRGSVYLREDFGDLADYDQVGRGLRRLVAKGKLVKIGYGLYARATRSPLSGNLIPEKSLPSLAAEALTRLKVEVRPSREARAYNAGGSTQVPTGRVLAVKGRISRKIGYDGKYVSFEPAARP
jgi:hypothetical protein